MVRSRRPPSAFDRTFYIDYWDDATFEVTTTKPVELPSPPLSQKGAHPGASNPKADPEGE